MIAGHLEQITAARSVEEVWSLHVTKMAEYGFDRLIYGYTRFRCGNSLGDPDDLLILSNHSTEYLDRFMGDRLFMHGPMVRWTLENEGACSWRWLQEQAEAGLLSDEEMAVTEFNRSMDVTAGYSVSFKSVSHREKGAIALTSKAGVSQSETDAMWKIHGTDILVTCNVTHLKLINLPGDTKRRPLTRRQREVLEWVSQGKTMQDVACIMGLTSATVEKHLRLARVSLDANTTAQAVMKATVQNQIFVIDV